MINCSQRDTTWIYDWEYWQNFVFLSMLLWIHCYAENNKQSVIHYTSNKKYHVQKTKQSLQPKKNVSNICLALLTFHHYFRLDPLVYCSVLANIYYLRPHYMTNNTSEMICFISVYDKVQVKCPFYIVNILSKKMSSYMCYIYVLDSLCWIRRQHEKSNIKWEISDISYVNGLAFINCHKEKT